MRRGTSFFTENDIYTYGIGINYPVTLYMFAIDTITRFVNVAMAVKPANHFAWTNTRDTICLLNHKHSKTALHFRLVKLHENSDRTKVISHNQRTLLLDHPLRHQLFIWLSSWATPHTTSTTQMNSESKSITGVWRNPSLLLCTWFYHLILTYGTGTSELLTLNSNIILFHAKIINIISIVPYFCGWSYGSDSVAVLQKVVP
jgi:hypothetical protein